MGQFARRLSALRMQRRDTADSSPAATFLDGQIAHVDSIVRSGADGDYVGTRWVLDSDANNVAQPVPHEPKHDSSRLFADAAEHERAMGAEDF